MVTAPGDALVEAGGHHTVEPPCFPVMLQNALLKEDRHQRQRWNNGNDDQSQLWVYRKHTDQRGENGHKPKAYVNTVP